MMFTELLEQATKMIMDVRFQTHVKHPEQALEFAIMPLVRKTRVLSSLYPTIEKDLRRMAHAIKQGDKASLHRLHRMIRARLMGVEEDLSGQKSDQVYLIQRKVNSYFSFFKNHTYSKI